MRESRVKIVRSSRRYLVSAETGPARTPADPMAVLRRAALLLLGLLGPLGVEAGARAQTQNPSMELRVVEAAGDPQVRADTGSAWEPVRSGRPLREDNQLRTGDGDTIVLADTGEVTLDDRPGAEGSTYLELAPDGELTVGNLEREIRPVTDGPGADTALFNELRLRVPTGALRIYLRSRETTRHDFRLETTSAAAGVRGTTFQCQAGDTTTCSVLEGEVRLEARGDTGRSVRVTGGHASSVAPGDTAPSEPDWMSQRARRSLTRFRSRARRQICSTPIDELMEP